MTRPKELARRAVKCARWRWMAGMATYPMDLPSMPGERLRVDGLYDVRDDDPLPDLSDPATLGCLLALVREVAQEPGLHVRCMLPYAPDMSGKSPPPWVLHSGRGQRWGDRYETEAEALVSALEAAP